MRIIVILREEVLVPGGAMIADGRRPVEESLHGLAGGHHGRDRGQGVTVPMFLSYRRAPAPCSIERKSRSQEAVMPEDFEYISRARLEYRGGYRNAYLGDVEEPVVYGVQGAIAITWDATVRLGDEVVTVSSEDAHAPTA
jgi:hypothetical protein